jgi:hypothetical protein
MPRQSGLNAINAGDNAINDGGSRGDSTQALMARRFQA